MPRYPIRARKRPGRFGVYRQLFVAGGAKRLLGEVLSTDTTLYVGTLGAESNTSTYGGTTLGAALNTANYPP